MKLPTLPFLNRISGRDKAFLARQLAAMLGSGLPLNKAVEILINQTRNERLLGILTTVQHDLETGLPFSAAIAKHPALFDRVFVNVVVSGEQVGKLADVLAQLADQLENDASFTSRVRGALAYPAFVFLAMIVVAAIMVTYIVPQLREVFEEAGATLPLTTRLLITLSDFLIHFWWVVLILLPAGLYLIAAYIRSAAGERVMGTIQIRLPGGLGYDIYMARFTRTLGMLVSAGTPIIESITVTGMVLDNVVYNEVLAGAAEQVKRGVPLSVPIQKSSLFPAIVGQMIEVGEQTGQLDSILLNLASYYEGEADAKIKQLGSLIEPVVIVIIGIGVAFLVYSILVPIYNIAQFQ
ncbi:type II secretion system F family protein [Candidatus Berkelbacteria bacterium]|nr:type II secretion system F family protein [Candidatus Berkelbacteria bacterium]